MGREADADEQLLRRRHRVFAAEERSFRMDRRSPAAAALRAAVADVLTRFLGSYSDDTLAEYIVVLVCNGKHQYQARDDLEAFLGDDSAKFVAWLWGYLSKRDLASADNSCVQHGLGNESWKLNDKKNLLAAEVQPGDARIVNSKILAPQDHHGLQKLDSTEGQNVAQRRISSTVIISPERLFGGQWYWEGQQQKKDQSATGGRSFSMPKSGVAARTAQALAQEELHYEEHLGGNASTRRLPLAVGTDNTKVPEHMKRRGNVWDRLGKPAIEDRGLDRETDDMHDQNGVNKKAKLMVAGHEQRCCVNSSADVDLFGKSKSRQFSNSYPYVNRVQAHEHAEKPNRSRLIGRINFGDVERNHLQVTDVISQMSSPTLPVKNVQSQSLNEFTSEVKSSPTAVSEPSCHISKASKGHVSASSKLSQLTAPRNSITEVLQSQQTSSPAQSKTGYSVREDGGNCSNKPVKDEMLDVKLKLKQMELNVLKLRSKQAQINNGKQGALSSGLHANLEEDTDSRTVLVTNVYKENLADYSLSVSAQFLAYFHCNYFVEDKFNELTKCKVRKLSTTYTTKCKVHFAAAKEALSTHFMKCGAVLKINMLTDAFTGHPKGAAYVTFADKESVEKAVSLSGTSFLSRALTVMHKADAPPGFLASVQQTGRPLQPWNSPPFPKRVCPKQSSSHHLQWKREQSVLEKSPATPASCPTN